MSEPHNPSVRVAVIALGLLGAGLLALWFSDRTWVGVLLTLTGRDEPVSSLLHAYYRDGQAILGAAILLSTLVAAVRPQLFHGLACIAQDLTDIRFRAMIFGAALLSALVLQWLLFENIPHVTDAISHDFQARILAEGKLFAPKPPCPDAFTQYHVIMTTDGKWFSKYTPGHPVLLAAGYLLRLRLLPVALCHALSAIAILALVRRFFNEATGRWVSLLFVLSPMAVLLGASFMSHTSFLCVALFGTLALCRSEAASRTAHAAGPAWGWALLAGLLWGWAVLTLPQDAVIAGGMVTVGAAVAYRGPWRRLIAVGMRALPGLLPPLLFLLVWNRAQYGTWLAIGYGFTQDQVVNRLYQGTYGFGPGFTLQDALYLTKYTLYRFDRALLGWPLTLPLCLLALWWHRCDRRDLACIACMAVHAGVYFFYDYYGMEYEARYYFNLTPFALLLLVRSFHPDLARPFPTFGWVRGVLIVAFFAHSFLHFWPRFVAPTYGTEYAEVSTTPIRHARALLSEYPEGTRLLIVVNVTPERRFTYGGGFLYTDPWLRGPILFAMRRPDILDCLRTAFPDRILYQMDPIDFHVAPLLPEDL